MVSEDSSETSIPVDQSIWRHIPEDGTRDKLRAFGDGERRSDGGTEKFLNEALRKFYWPPNVMMIMSRSMRLTGHVTRMGERNGYTFFGEKSRTSNTTQKPGNR
jgi:hypothetical protein